MVESLRLMPYFFIRITVENDKIVDITKPIDELRFLVSLLNVSSDTSAAPKRGPSPAGDISLTILNLTRLHAESMFSVHRHVTDAQEANKLVCTWQTFIAARYCFLYGVLELSKFGTPPEIDLPSHLCTLLLGDVDSSISAPALNQYNPDLWIWIFFSAALTLKRFWQALIDQSGVCMVDQWHRVIVNKIKAWEESMNIRVWHNVEDVLKRIAWPETQREDVITLWHVFADV